MTNIEILNNVFEPMSFDCKTERQDLQLAITLNPQLDLILLAMETARVDELKIAIDGLRAL